MVGAGATGAASLKHLTAAADDTVYLGANDGTPGLNLVTNDSIVEPGQKT